MLCSLQWNLFEELARWIVTWWLPRSPSLRPRADTLRLKKRPWEIVRNSCLLRRAESGRLRRASQWLMPHLDAAAGLASGSLTVRSQTLHSVSSVSWSTGAILGPSSFLGIHKSLSSLLGETCSRCVKIRLLCSFRQRARKIRASCQWPKYVHTEEKMESHSQKK